MESTSLLQAGTGDQPFAAPNAEYEPGSCPNVGLSNTSRVAGQLVECAGKAQRRRRFGPSPGGWEKTGFFRAACASSRAARLSASRRSVSAGAIGLGPVHGSLGSVPAAA